ncbi:TBC1 domain family member 1-like [Acipenser oxyrinchus oxyrinchus]|uniref:TBC1 domain family member 4 n=1 Tax=Acipenser oxyrinchus oxyrinchus TaxID=40147 RepID=A0AAD8GJ40_ACIOX|nr:TBC1 domain family member 1-like [Acipenser oxyrinchus oxyrinchus]
MDTGGISFEARQRTEPSSLAELSSAHPEKNSLYYRLQLVGFLPVHTLTTTPMLPWIVAEIRRHSSQGVRSALIPRWVKLYISQAAVCCEMDAGYSQQWDPLHYNIIFEHQPQRVYKLIHNSNDPSYFACLIREPGPGLPGNKSTCYVFRSADQAKVPEIISTIRQAGKTARQEEAHSHYHKPDDAFSKKFEVLFCGRVIVAHKKAPPALIDECIEKFNHISAKKKDGETTSDQDVSLEPQGSSAANGKHALFFQAAANGIDCSKSGNFSTANPNCQKTVFLKRDSSLPSFATIGGNGVSPEIRRRNISEPCGVQPTDIQANRTMLFTIGQSQIYLISPDTKKVAIEKSFREISFCSQGIRHVDHFGFICRESSENGNCHFVCYVFQCTNEALVDEIMMTLKQAFSVAAVHHNSRTQALQCESCPMQHLHKLCERIEGLHPSKAKLELQKHLATLNNKETAAVFEEVLKVRPKCKDEENELVISSLRSLYEKKQKNHSHSYNREGKQPSQNCSEDVPNELQMSAGRLRLEMLKTRAKRSLTESLEGILSRGGNKPRHQKESFESVDTDNSSSNTTLHSINKEPSITDALAQPLSVSSVKAHRSTGDLQGLVNPSHKSPRHGFRQRSKTLSHLPILSQQPLQPVEESPSIPKPRLMRHYSVGTETPHECSLNVLDSDDKSPAAPLSAPTPPARLMAPSASSSNFFKSIKQNSGGEQSGCMLKRRQYIAPCFSFSPEWADVAELPSRVSLAPVCGDGLPVPVVQERKKTEHELRELWKKTILQQILLLRMEKENQKLQASESDLQNKRIKLDYEEITPCLKEVTLIWEKMLNMPGRPKIKFDMEKIHVAMGQGVPRQHRGEIWKFLAEQYQLHHPLPSKHQANDTPYKELLKQLTSQQHAILIDLGRTFPTHPYFSAQLGAGQLSLYNLLKAYSLLDPEVGYCQGLSFVAGILLLHMSEEDAFEMLKFLMYDVGLRKQYRPDMIILQIQMYELSRLLHDYHRDLYNLLEEYEIGPSLYAAPWFLTIFASQFPLGFVARVFDMIFLQGAEVIFKVALSLLGSHKPLILQHDNLETIVDFIKTTLPNLGLVQMEKTIIQVFEMDISKQLQAYEVEYHVLQDELMDSVLPLSDNEKMEMLEKANSSLRQQNIDLLEEIQAAHAKIHYLELNIENFVKNEGNLKQAIRTLELERLALLNTVEELQGCMQTQDFTEDKTVLEQP